MLAHGFGMISHVISTCSFWFCFCFLPPHHRSSGQTLAMILCPTSSQQKLNKQLVLFEEESLLVEHLPAVGLSVLCEPTGCSKGRWI